jgi:hypothetical protein
VCGGACRECGVSVGACGGFVSTMFLRYNKFYEVVPNDATENIAYLN